MVDPNPRTVTDVLAALLREPGRPRLTWYGPDGERIELSGAVLDNWVSKTGNLLAEEFDAGPGISVLLDLPTHWRTLVWAVAAWRCGATVSFPRTDVTADLVVTDHPERHPQADQLVAVALPALSRSWTGSDLPAGAVDAASAVMTYGDVLGWVPATEPDEDALPGLRYRDLVSRALAGAVPGSRTLLTEDPADPTSVLLRALGIWAAGGSLVLAPGAADDRVQRIVATEQITEH